ncbi:hypothetical protein [Streptomyces sp. NPDC018711]|uniref:hypothetical protein n=1 Tax=Streptomyces sp. NPDC018711 TaxID=3365052 RepID=UPI00379DEDE7
MANAARRVSAVSPLPFRERRGRRLSKAHRLAGLPAPVPDAPQEPAPQVVLQAEEG